MSKSSGFSPHWLRQARGATWARSALASCTFLLLAPAFAAPQCPVVLPPFAQGEDVAVVAPHDPALASDAALGPAVDAMDDLCDLATALRWIDASALPPIARERLTLAAVLRSAESGGVDDLDPLAYLGLLRPQAVYEAPVCRRPEPHPWFDFSEAARQAARRIRFRDGQAMKAATLASSKHDALLLAEAMSNGLDSDRLAGFYRACLDRPFVPGGSIDANHMRKLLRDRACTPDEYGVFVRESERAGRADLLEAIAAEAPPANADAAVRAYGRARGTGTSQRLVALFRDGTETAVLGSLDARDANAEDVWNYVVALLGDDRLGADAAAALVRISPEKAAHLAREVLASKDADALSRRRAVLVLMRDDVPGGKDALAAWIAEKSDDDRAVREEVERWLAQEK